ncbi:MAG: hypothetical protein ACRCS9_08685 [Hyphomicrobium sp.]
MRTVAVKLSLVSAFFAFTAGAALADCGAEVATAFDKQRMSQMFRMVMDQSTAEGPVTMTVDYIPPSKMLQTVTAAHMPGDQQTMLVGDRAFAGSGGVWEELLPHFTQSIVAEVNTAVGERPKTDGRFDCLGKATIDGRDLIAYRTKPTGTDKSELLRTVYVDPASGLPAFNVVAAAGAESAPAAKVTYSYPTDIVIEAPQGAPVQKLQ